MFNAQPRIDILPVVDGRSCYVIDDALADPDALVAHAMRERDNFRAAPFNAYPGVELRMPDGFTAQLDDLLRSQLRRHFDVRRTLRRHSRLSMVTLQAASLQPAQWLCHRDRMSTTPDQRIIASMLYLFQDPALGGTSFYAPRMPREATEQLMRDAVTQDGDTFAAARGVAAGYMTASNGYFDKVLSVDARYNRLICYDGDLFHSGDIHHPDRLSDDPRSGRLSLNGFMTCSRSAR